MSDTMECAVRLLSQREHSIAELKDKLLQKGHPAVEIQSVVARCCETGLQSDERFAESLLRVRMRQGYGPLRIAKELKAKHVDSQQIEAVLAAECDNWLAHALTVLKKKAKTLDHSSASQQKLKQFLYYRGFSGETIIKAMQLL